MKHYISIIFPLFLLLMVTSCRNEMLEETINGDGTHTCRMSFNGIIGNYNDEATTRATVSIANGAKLYLVFKKGSSSVKGTAVYHSTEKEWSLTYTDSLSSSGSCSAYYIPDATEQNGTVELSSSTKVYGSTAGSYTNSSDGSITVSATLNPMLSRFRLKGVAGTKVSVEGVKLPTTFTSANGSMQSSTAVIPLTVNSDGYSDYVYYVEPSSDSLTVINGSKQYTVKTPLKSGGTSGYITIPTETSHSGWQMNDKPAEPEAVDLGLPSGTLWATFNVGANSPEDYGLYFAWGETTGYTSDTSDGRSFNWASYKWMTSGQSSWTGCTKYTFADGQTSGCWYSGSTYVGTTVNGVTYTYLTKLEAADDAATVNWGSGWCMPTHAQQVELVNSSYTTTTWTTKNGVYGRLITSKTNGNSIFLPAAGYRSNAGLGNVGSYGVYWSSELNSNYSYGAWLLYFSSSNVYTNNYSSRY